MSIEGEKRTIKKMIEIYCWKKHGYSKGKLCPQCKELLDYAYKRLDSCPFGDDKPTCRRCKIHCYSPEMEKRIKEVMRFSGPRLILFMPVEWIFHEIRDIILKLNNILRKPS